MFPNKQSDFAHPYDRLVIDTLKEAMCRLTPGVTQVCVCGYGVDVSLICGCVCVGVLGAWVWGCVGCVGGAGQ